jgi:hypothetical protein
MMGDGLNDVHMCMDESKVPIAWTSLLKPWLLQTISVMRRLLCKIVQKIKEKSITH